MQVEAVIVCKDYSDFLEHTLPHNLTYLDHLVVVTHPDDHKTKALCRKYSVTYVETTCMHDEGAKFNKGRAINLGLAHLKGLDWIVHLDADIVLPYDFKNLLIKARLNQRNVYGADRMNVYGYESWMDHKKEIKPTHKENYFIDAPHEFTMGSRIVHFEHGYCPIGFFQLWHKSAGKRYPIHQGTAEHTDVLFSCQWTREQRILLPEVICYHLESTSGPTAMGANWNGRKTPPFEKPKDKKKCPDCEHWHCKCKHKKHHPAPPPHGHHEHHHHTHHHHGHHGYKPKC